MAKVNRKNEELITQTELKRLFKYDQLTGDFTRLVSVGYSKAGSVAGSFIKATGYHTIKIAGKSYQAHRLVWLYMVGKWPTNSIDHINGIKTDNRFSNLRDVSHQENHKNQRTHSNNTSGFTGVFWHKGANKWGAQIRVSGKGLYLGLFEELEDAITARKAANLKYGFHINHGRKAA